MTIQFRRTLTQADQSTPIVDKKVSSSTAPNAGELVCSGAYVTSVSASQTAISITATAIAATGQAVAALTAAQAQILSSFIGGTVVITQGTAATTGVLATSTIKSVSVNGASSTVTFNGNFSTALAVGNIITVTTLSSNRIATKIAGVVEGVNPQFRDKNFAATGTVTAKVLHFTSNFIFEMSTTGTASESNIGNTYALAVSSAGDVTVDITNGVDTSTTYTTARVIGYLSTGNVEVELINIQSTI